jgi:hypothetical protein
MTTYALLYIGEDEKKVKICYAFFLIILWFQALFMCISFGQLKLTPYKNLSPSMTDITDKLLICAVEKIPLLNKSWGLVKDCAHAIKVYHVPKAKVPIVQNIPVAFVTPKIFPDDVFVVNSEYDILSNTSKALVIIHECTHLVLNTVDHAYLWQSRFNTLTSVKHLENADSYVDIILNNCINDTYVF